MNCFWKEENNKCPPLKLLSLVTTGPRLMLGVIVMVIYVLIHAAIKMKSSNLGQQEVSSVHFSGFS